MTEQPDVIIHFPKPPSANRMFLRQMTRRGHRDLTPEYKAWRDEAGWILKMQIVGLVTITTRFNIVVEIPRSSRVDLDNNLKPILDLAQNMGVISNDRNCAGITITPADRSDCMAAFWCLPAMDGVRKQAAPRGGGQRAGRVRAMKPKGKRAALTWKLPA